MNILSLSHHNQSQISIHDFFNLFRSNQQSFEQEKFKHRIYLNMIDIFQRVKALNLPVRQPLHKLFYQMKTEWDITCSVSNHVKRYSYKISFRRNNYPYSFMENHSDKDLLQVCTAMNNNSFNLNKNRKMVIQDNNLAVYFSTQVQRMIEREIEKKIFREIIVLSIILYNYFQQQYTEMVDQGRNINRIYRNHEKNPNYKEIIINDSDLQTQYEQNSAFRNINIIRNVQFFSPQSKPMEGAREGNLIRKVQMTAEIGDTIQHIPQQKWRKIEKQTMVIKTNSEGQKNEKITFKNPEDFIPSKYLANFQTENLKMIRNRDIAHPNLSQIYLQIREQENEEIVPQVQPRLYSKQYDKTLEKWKAFNRGGKDGKLLNFMKRLKIFFQIIKALSFLKKKKIIHYDIKSKNIMITTSSNIVKIIDFGCYGDLTNNVFLSLKNQKNKETENLQKMKQRMTPKSYDSSITLDDVFHQNFDIYGLGVILKQLFLEEQNIFQNYKNTDEESFIDKFRDVHKKTNCRPTKMDIKIGQIMSFFKKVLQSSDIEEKLSKIEWEIQKK